MSKESTPPLKPDNTKAPEELPSAPEQSADSQAVEAASQSGYNWESMLLPEDADGDLRTEEVPGLPRLSRPSNTAFFRTRAGHSGNINTLEVDYDGERTVHLVAPQVAKLLPGEAAIKSKRAVVCITREGALHLWLISLGGTDTWTYSAIKATELAENQWVRATSSRSLGEYRCVTAEGIDEQPKWPKESFIDILSRAFDGRVIDTLNHAIIRQLKGLE